MSKGLRGTLFGLLFTVLLLTAFYYYPWVAFSGLVIIVAVLWVTRK